MYPPVSPDYNEREVSFYGFPAGYFMIKSRATGRVLDVEADSREDGAEVILWPARESSRVLTLRDPTTDNQLFFLDGEGTLCSKASGHAIDVEKGRLVLRHRRPTTIPYPNTYSHPMPRFEYLDEDGTITLRFPASKGPERDFMLAALPSKKPRTLIDNVADSLSTAATTVFFAPFTLTGLASPSASQTQMVTADEVEGAEFSLRDHELADEDLVNEEGQPDDNPDMLRRVRVFTRDKRVKLGPKALARRQWDVISILRQKLPTGSGKGGFR